MEETVTDTGVRLNTTDWTRRQNLDLGWPQKVRLFCVGHVTFASSRFLSQKCHPTSALPKGPKSFLTALILLAILCLSLSPHDYKHLRERKYLTHLYFQYPTQSWKLVDNQFLIEELTRKE